MINYILGSDSLTVFFKGNSYTINRQAQTFNLVLEAIKNQDEDALSAALNSKQTIAEKLGDNVSIVDGEIIYKDRPVTGLIASRIFEMLDMGLDVQPMVKFINNLMQNPSKRAVDELFGFLEACTLPITPDGHFLAYKRIREDYKDVHSGTMDNSVGKIVEMQRNAVDEDKNNTCSYGLHFCSYDYLQHFTGARIVVVKINPADVVAIPADYNNSKGRTCRYEVVDELPLNEYKMPEKQLDLSWAIDYDDLDLEESDDVFDYLEEDIFDDCEELDNVEQENTQQDLTTTNKSAKLDADDVRKIRAMIDGARYNISQIAAIFGVSERQIRRIRDGLAWKNIC